MKNVYIAPPICPVKTNLPVFQERLKAELNAQGYGAQAHIMRKTGLSSGTIRNYMYGRAIPMLNAAIALADALGVSLDWLTGRSDKKHLEK